MGKPIKITGLISGGNIGSDPWHPLSFSGSSASLFSALKDEGVLVRAFGLDISRAEFLLRSAPRWHPSREVWRRRVYQSAGYRRALTRDLKRKIIEADRDTVVLQLGAFADGPALYRGIAPVITYQDGLGAEYWLSPYSSDAIKRDKRLRNEHWSFEIGVAKGAARVLTSSEHTRQLFIDNYGVEPAKVRNVRIGYNTRAPATPPKKDYSRPELVFIGKDFERKGGDLLHDAFVEIRRAHPEAVLHVIGPPTRPGSLPDAPGIVFHGFLSRNDPAQAKIFYEVLERAALSLLPTRYEPLGIAPLEAMTYGAPAIVTNSWALRENIEHGVTGFLLADLSSASIASAVIEALSDKDRLARMGETAAAQTLARFSWRGVALRIIEAAEAARDEFRAA